MPPSGVQTNEAESGRLEHRQANYARQIQEQRATMEAELIGANQVYSRIAHNSWSTLEYKENTMKHGEGEWIETERTNS